MTVAQIWQFTNDALTQALGESAVLLAEDLSNIVSVGKQFQDSATFDRYVEALVDKVGKQQFVDRVYASHAPSIMVDGWEYGSMLEKIYADIPDAEENPSWNLQHGQTYNQDIFTKPSVHASLFNDKTTYSIPLSIAEYQAKSGLLGAQQQNALISMLHNSVNNAMTMRTDALILRALNNMMALTFESDYTGAALGSKSGVRAVNLLYLYNQRADVTTPLTAAQAITNPAFMRFAAREINRYLRNMTTMSTLFNISGRERFTSRDRLHVIMLSDFVADTNVYLQSDVWHNELTALPNGIETIPYWQGSGGTFAFNDVSAINVAKSSSGYAVNATGIIGLAFDREAVAVANQNPRVRQHTNARADFYNYWYKMDAMYLNDPNENFVLFFVNDTGQAAVQSANTLKTARK